MLADLGAQHRHGRCGGQLQHPIPSTLSRHLAEHVPSLLIAAFLYVIAFHFHRLYRYAWRFAAWDGVAVIGPLRWVP